MTAHTSGRVSTRPGSMAPLAPPPVSGPRMARLLETADDENAAVDPLLEGVDRLRVPRVARAELATVSAGGLREALALLRAGSVGGPS